MCACVLSRVQFCGPIDCSQPGSSVNGMSWQAYWKGLPFPILGHIPDPGIKPMYPALAGEFFTTEPPGKWLYDYAYVKTHRCFYLKKYTFLFYVNLKVSNFKTKIFSDSFSLHTLNYFTDNTVDHPQSIHIRKELISHLSLKIPAGQGPLRRKYQVFI